MSPFGQSWFDRPRVRRRGTGFLGKGSGAVVLKQRRRATYSDLGDICGCAMGARFLAVMLIASLLWYGWHWQETILSPWAAAAHILVFALIASGIGKLVGILLYKYRFHFS